MRKRGRFFADEDKICKSAVVRTRKEGDVFEKFGGGRKKLKSYYIDLKYPARLRSKLLLIAEGGKFYFPVWTFLKNKSGQKHGKRGKINI